MKIAYVGYDRSCLKTAKTLAQLGCDVVYFLTKPEQDLNFAPFDTAFIFSHPLMIPALAVNRTAAQRAEYAVVENNFKILRRNMCADMASTAAENNRDVETRSNIQPLSEIMDIHYDSKRKTVVVELEKKGIETFDMVLTESHPLVSIFFDSKKIKIFKVFGTPSVKVNYIWTSIVFEYEAAKPVVSFQQDQDFFLVLDRARQSIIDNWFYCVIKKESVAFWTFQPIHQVNNPEFKNFYIDRIRTAITERFSFLHLKNFLNSEVSTVGSAAITVRVALPATLEVPNFSFWNGTQIESFLSGHLSKTIRRLKKNSEVSL